MTSREIKAFAARTGYDAQFSGVSPRHRRVVVKAPAEAGGLYMTLTGFNGKTSADAFVYDYTIHAVKDQVLSCHLQGMFIEVEAAPEGEAA